MSELNDKIYKLLYDKSIVDGVRILHEDEWPIDELEYLIQQERIKAQEEVIKELDRIPYLEFTITVLKNLPTGMFDSTPYKEEQLKSLENELKQSLAEREEK